MKSRMSWRSTQGSRSSRKSSSSAPVAFLRAGSGLGRFDFTVARGCVGHEMIDQPPRDGRHLIHGLIEQLLVGVGGLGGSADFPHELKRRRPDLVVGCRRLKIGQGPDVSAHGCCLLYTSDAADE